MGQWDLAWNVCNRTSLFSKEKMPWQPLEFLIKAMRQHAWRKTSEGHKQLAALIIIII